MAGKRTILIDGRGSENALEVEGKIWLESALFELIDGQKAHTNKGRDRVEKRFIYGK